MNRTNKLNLPAPTQVRGLPFMMFTRLWRASSSFIITPRRALLCALSLLALCVAAGCRTRVPLKGRYQNDILVWCAKRLPYEPSPVPARIDEFADRLVAAASSKGETEKLGEQCQAFLDRDAALNIGILMRGPKSPPSQRQIDILPYLRFPAYAVLWKLDMLPHAMPRHVDDVEIQIADIGKTRQIGAFRSTPVTVSIRNRSARPIAFSPLTYLVIRAADKTLAETDLASLDRSSGRAAPGHRLRRRRQRVSSPSQPILRRGQSQSFKIDCASPRAPDKRERKRHAILCYWEYPPPAHLWIGSVRSPGVSPPPEVAPLLNLDLE